jgi:hypothetical protein
MGWWILVFYPEPEVIDQPMLKLKTHSGFHELFTVSVHTVFLEKKVEINISFTDDSRTLDAK